MKKYLRLIGVLMKLSLMSQLEYRVNFIAGVAVEMGWMLVKLLYVAVVYRIGVNISVFTPNHIQIFIGIYVLMTGFYMLYYPNFAGLGQMVQSGELDMYLVKPVSLQFIVTLRQWSFPMFLTNAIAGSILIITGWQKAGLAVSVKQILGFLFLLLCSNLLTYSLFLIPYLMCFWIVSTGGIESLSSALWDFNNMPYMIYGKWIQRIGTFILPIFIITNFPGLFLMGDLHPAMFVWAIVAPVLFFYPCANPMEKSCQKLYQCQLIMQKPSVQWNL